MKATIRDVAVKAGVSVATVSRVLNGTANVNLIKKHKVEEAIEELGFSPNFIARSLSKKNTNTIGLILPSIVNPFFNEIAEAVEKRARVKGYRVILCNSSNDAEKEKQYISSLMQNQVDGFVIISDNKPENNVKVPVVYLDRYGVDMEHRHPIIRSNHYEGGLKAANHLIEKGCRKIAYIGKEKIHEDKNERIDGFVDAAEKAGVEWEIIYCEYDYDSGGKGAAELFDKRNDIDGIFAGNDLIAYAVIREASDRSVKIPEELQLVGYDDIMFSKLLTPALTTIAQPVEALGKLAVDVILDILSEKRYVNKDIVLPVNLVKRNTTKKDEV
jgi:DNA-binding LacI/PurR family transcriptional regulator